MPPVPPLPSRPKTTVQETPDEDLPEKTRLEQQGGRDALELARAKLRGEMEEGMRRVELNRQMAERKLTKDSERGDE